MTASAILRREKRGTFFAHHPWVLDKSIEALRGAPGDGDEVELTLPDGAFVARGVFNSQSRIRVRLYSWDREESLDEPFWRRRVERAIALRRDLGLLGPDSAARLVFSEADGLSGLIVDHYAGHLVVQITALAMERRLPLLLGTLAELLAPRAMLVRIEQRAARAEGLAERQDWALGEAPATPISFDEHGVRIEVDLSGGQKTGYYLDQRDNRRRAAELCRGRKVLDVCCYQGGFSLAAAKLGGAAEVLGIDASQRAVDLAAEHAARNDCPQAKFEVGDCFERLEQLAASGERFGMVVLDPPRFAGSRRTIPQALNAYHRLNRLALQCLEPDGYLVTCSCSGLVTREDFVDMLAGAAQRARRDVQLLDQRGAAPDHPVLLSCPETEYLKCLVARVG